MSSLGCSVQFQNTHLFSDSTVLWSWGGGEGVLPDPQSRRGHKKHLFLPNSSHWNSLYQIICCSQRLSNALKYRKPAKGQKQKSELKYMTTPAHKTKSWCWTPEYCLEFSENNSPQNLNVCFKSLLGLTCFPLAEKAPLFSRSASSALLKCLAAEMPFTQAFALVINEDLLTSGGWFILVLKVPHFAVVKQFLQHKSKQEPLNCTFLYLKKKA